MKAILKNIAPDGEPLEAVYIPEKGMNLVSYRKGGIQVIDEATTPLFEQRSAGLGALIGPHFYQQNKAPSGFDESLFPHIAISKSQGRKDPFSHGIARYVPWKFVKSETQIQAELRGSDLYKGVPLSAFEGQDFHMKYEARLLSDGLYISCFIDSERPSLVGLHYYYAVRGHGLIHGEVQNTYRDQEKWKEIPTSWLKSKETHLNFPLPQTADFGFLPAKKHETDRDYHLILDTEAYSLHFQYSSSSDSELSVQIFHPEKASYVCIEPLSACFPPKPKLTRSRLEVKLQIFSPLSE